MSLARPPSPFDLAAVRYAEPEQDPYPTPGALAMALDKEMRNPLHLQLIDQALVAVAERRIERLLIIAPPQEGKSERVSHYNPLWLLRRNPNLRIGIVSFEDERARRWGRTIRNDVITYNGTVTAPDGAPIDLGIRLRADSKAAGRWHVRDARGSVYCTGWAGPLTGEPLDYLIIDDPVKGRKEADSETYRNDQWDWWLDTAQPRLAPGAPVVVIQTRWHEDDFAGRLLKNDPQGWTVLHIPAQADHNPDAGESDPLGREVGEFLNSARGRSLEQWAAIKVRSGSRTFQALYQGRPSSPAGTILKRSWWRYHHGRASEVDIRGQHRAMPGALIVQSWDMAFKDLDTSDYVVGQVWDFSGVNAYLLDQVRGRMDFTASVAALRALHAKWPDTGAVLVEDKANGTAVINALRDRIPGLIAISPTESKISRATAVSPFIESGNVFIPDPDLAPWVGELVEEAAAFPTGADDDQVDAMTQALRRLFLPDTPPGQQHVTAGERWGAIRTVR